MHASGPASEIDSACNLPIFQSSSLFLSFASEPFGALNSSDVLMFHCRCSAAINSDGQDFFFLKKIAAYSGARTQGYPTPLRQLLPLGSHFPPVFSHLRRGKGCFPCTRYTFGTSHRLKTALSTLRTNLGHRLAD